MRDAWLSAAHADFTDHARVAALGGARSHAGRLYDDAGERRDQVRWVMDRLPADSAMGAALA